MPATKKGGGAPTKAAPAKKKPAAKPATTRPRRKAGAGGKTYKLFSDAGDGHLKLLATAKGANGNIAAVNAVKAGDVEPGVPVIPVIESAVSKPITVNPKQRDPTYEVVQAKKARRKPAAKSSPEPTPEPEPDAAEETAEEPSAKEEKPKPKTTRRGGRRKAAAKPAGSNPFA